jgi:hypothetical protein
MRKGETAWEGGREGGLDGGRADKAYLALDLFGVHVVGGLEGVGD